MTPLRQFKGVPTEVIRKAEGKQFVGVVCTPAYIGIDRRVSPGTVILTSLPLKSENSLAFLMLVGSYIVWSTISLSCSA
jgi:hypothetical protein